VTGDDRYFTVPEGSQAMLARPSETKVIIGIGGHKNFAYLVNDMIARVLQFVFIPSPM
jgi:hypothetical protein